MRKSIGGKIYTVLASLGVVFVLVLLMNNSALAEIESNNTTVSTYMQMQEIKSEVSTAFQQVQLYSNLVYFKKDKADERELMITKLEASRVTMDEQLTKAKYEDRRHLTFHKMLLNDELPLTMGGGIGQSRLCMLILGKAHVGEVQVSVWDKETVRICKEANVELL